MSDVKNNCGGVGDRGARGGYEARRARWSSFPAWMAAGVFTREDSFDLPGWIPVDEVRLWLAKVVDGSAVLSRHRLRVADDVGEVVVREADASWAPAIRHSLDRRRDPLATKVANCIIKAAAEANPSGFPASPGPMFGYLNRPEIRTSNDLRAAARALHGLAFNADPDAAQLESAWTGVSTLWVESDGRSHVVYPSRFVASDLRLVESIHPTDGSAAPDGPGSAGEIRGGWVFARDRWIPRMPTPDAVYFNSREVAGVGGFHNPVLKVLGPEGMGLFTEPRSALRDADGAAALRYAELMDGLISADDPSTFEAIGAEVWRRLPEGLAFTAGDVGRALFHPMDQVFASAQPRPFFFRAKGLSAELARWDYSAAALGDVRIGSAAEPAFVNAG